MPGLNNGYDLSSKYVLDDAAVDSLAGNDGDDWFWALPTEVSDQQFGERLN
jgi:hypothetical protein